MPVSAAGNRNAGGSAAGEALSAQAALLAGLGLKFAPLPEVTVGPDQSVTFILPRGFRWPLIQRGVMLAIITGIGLLLWKTPFAAIPFFSGPFLIGFMLRAPLAANWKHDPYFDNKVQVLRRLAALYTGASPGR